MDTERVLQLRQEGYTYEEIARMLGRSIFYVYSRINPRYAPKNLRVSGEKAMRPIKYLSKDNAPRRVEDGVESLGQESLRSIRWIGAVRESIFSACGVTELRQLYELAESWREIPNLEAVENMLDSHHGSIWRQKMGGSYLMTILYSTKCIVEAKLAILEQLNLPSASTEFYVDLEYGEYPFCIGVKIVNRDTVEKFQRFVESKAEAENAIQEFNAIRKDASDYVAYTWSGQDSKLLSLEDNHIDLYSLVNQSMMLPMKSFNVKEVARYFGHHPPPLSIADGLDCLLTFGQYMASTDEPLRKKLRSEIEEYNWNDVESLYNIAAGIKTVC